MIETQNYRTSQLEAMALQWDKTTSKLSHVCRTFADLPVRFVCSARHPPNNLFIFFRHVQVNNDSAIKFYERFGFEIVERKANYYKRIEPADAFVLQKTFRKTEQTSSKNNNDIEHIVT